jgi:hypothetical protein
VVSLGAEVATKVSQAALNSVATTLSSNLNAVSSLLGTRASSALVTAQLATKQDLLDETITLSSGLFQISGANNSFSIQRLVDGAYSTIMSMQYNNATGASRIGVFGELRPSSINGLSSLDLTDTLTATQVLAQNLYTKVQVDELLSTYAYRIADDSLSIAKIADLQPQLDTINEIRRAIQVQLAGATEYGVYTRDDLTALTSVVATKQDKIDRLSSVILGTVTASGISTLTHTTGTLESGPISCSIPGVENSLLMASFGNDSNTIRLTGGAFIDSYKTVEGDGRTLYLNYRSNGAI